MQVDSTSARSAFLYGRQMRVWDVLYNGPYEIVDLLAVRHIPPRPANSRSRSPSIDGQVSHRLRQSRLAGVPPMLGGRPCCVLSIARRADWEEDRECSNI